MNGAFLSLIGRTLGVLGFLICAAVALARVTGTYFIGTFQLGTVFVAGVGAMIGGCFFLLWVLVSRSER